MTDTVLISIFYVCFTGQVVITERNIYIENMPIITPNGDVIVKSLSLQVHTHAKRFGPFTQYIYLLIYLTPQTAFIKKKLSASAFAQTILSL